MRKIFLILSIFALTSYGERLLSVWGGGEKGWMGWEAKGSFAETTYLRPANPFPSIPHFESSETGTALLRSPIFTVQGDILRFWVNGWDGRSGEKGKNFFYLRSAEDGKILRTAIPPLSDEFQPLCWFIGSLKGKRVYFEAVDNNKDAGFAWLGVALVEEVKKDIPQDKSNFYAVPLHFGLGTFRILNYDGAHRPTPPYLSSLGGGEQGTGAIRSPTFTIKTQKIRLLVNGWDGQQGGRGENCFQLVDAETKEILRSSPPPLSDFPKWIEWDTANLQERKVYIRIIDGDPEPAFAWLGLWEVDAGKEFQIRFSENPSLSGWSAEGEQPLYTERLVLFLSSSYPQFSENSSIRLLLNVKAKHLFLLGMTNSLDQGCPIWGDPNDRASRFFIGDELGKIKIKYVDGKEEIYPLVLGESLWWGKIFHDFPEPFSSNPKAKKVLQDTLRLFPQAPIADGRYLAVINPRPIAIYSFELVDSKDKKGAPTLYGLTIETYPGERFASGIPLPADKPSKELLNFIKDKALLSGKFSFKRVENLAKALYICEDALPSHLPLSIPPAYKGPLVRFEGNIYADILSNAFYHNVLDILNKIDEEGMYHTSTKNAPSWGGYQGFGTFRKNVGTYYQHSWSRDLGRSLQELVSLGYLCQAENVADYCFRMALLWKDKGFPPHWCRIINIPTPGEGNFENDGHGLISLFIYKLWQRLPNNKEWLSRHWQDVQFAGDWIIWQFENADKSGATDVLLTDSECAAGVGRSVFADYVCMEALQALAEMAESVGKMEKAREWRERAGKMRKAIERNYIVVEPKYGKVWTLSSSGWPNHSTVLGPLILHADRRGFLPLKDDPDWAQFNLAAYHRLIDSYKPFGFYGVAMGYGQGFITQSALLLDKMKDATKMLEWMAREIYDPKYEPYITPEGCEVSDNGRYWHRTGDLGNGVQEAEIVKTLRIVIGIDNPKPGNLRLIPRIPYGWNRMEIKDYPVWLEGGVKTGLEYRLVREGKGMEMEIKADKQLPSIEIRIGPFSEKPSQGEGNADGKRLRGKLEKSGDSWWIWFKSPSARKIEIWAN
ncbi:MAG: hypothetical protein ACPLPS_05115 [bacterium]